MDLKLKDKVVLINGSTGGVGKELVKAFAAEGCRLAISSTSQEKLDAFVPTLDIDPDKLATWVVDFRDEEQIKTFVNGAAEKYGTIDVIIPNAGYEGKFCEVQNATFEDYMDVFSLNLFGAVFMTKYAAPYMIKQGRGAVVAIASNGSFTGTAGMAAYSASKHALAGFMKSMTLELGPKGIQCNFICPGAIETPMIHRIEASMLPGMTHEEAVKAIAAVYVDKRYCMPEEVAYVALFLASELSSHMQGSALRLDGGMDASD